MGIAQCPVRLEYFRQRAFQTGLGKGLDGLGDLARALERSSPSISIGCMATCCRWPRIDPGSNVYIHCLP
jgi:hypothetical protein